jgi:hypothetical protein
MWFILLIALMILLILDWLQTEQIALNPDRWYETNLILGSHPSREAVGVYFLAWIIGTPTIAIILPEQWSLAVMSIGILIECACVVNNHRLGIKFW